MAIITPGDVAFNGTEVRDLADTIYEAIYEKPALSMFHNVVGGIKAKDQIVSLSTINGLTGKGTGGCDPTDDDNTITMSEKFWMPETVSNSLPSCWTDLKASFWIYGTNNGIKKADLTKTDFFNFLVDRYKDALYEELLRIVWFGDTAADHVSGAGNITDSTDLAYFNRIDGLWKQYFAIGAADPLRVTAGLAARNGQVSYALQEFDSTDTDNLVVTNTLQNMMYGADYRLRGMANLKFVVTQSVADQHSRELKAANVAFTTERLENGITVLKSDGVEVIAFQFWDRIIRAYENTGAAYYLPHRAVMLTRENTQIGTEAESTFSEFNIFYDQKSEKNYLRTKYDVDAKIIEDYLVQLAY